MLPNLIRYAEKIVLLVLSGGVILRLMPDFSLHPQILLVLASELAAVFFLLIQRKGVWSSDPYHALIAFAGTGAALCMAPIGETVGPESVSIMLITIGTTIALFAKLSLRRSFGLIPANRGVKTRGAYRFVRHPMYTGYVLTHIGFMMIYFSVWNICVYATAWILLYLRAVEEEKFLRQDPEYVAYSDKVRARIIPGLV